MRRFVLAAAALAVAAVAGCEYPRSRLHGTIQYQGKPLTGATIMFFSRDGQVYRTGLKSDGTYEVDGVVRGPVRVAIQQDLPRVAPRPEQPRPGEKDSASKADDGAKMSRVTAPAGPVAPTGPQIPAKYTDPGQSGLAFELKDADQEFSVELK